MYENHKAIFDLHSDQIEWLSEMSKQYALTDESKTLRVLLEFVQTEADLEVVFNKIRCNRC